MSHRERMRRRVHDGLASQTRNGRPVQALEAHSQVDLCVDHLIVHGIDAASAGSFRSELVGELAAGLSESRAPEATGRRPGLARQIANAVSSEVRAELAAQVVAPASKGSPI